ncbi:hypothetical protein HA402_015864 [Bradysia odoriphaga]|nr:hypothetical protein HA402_015864 [Bradysia odoriphaga]
MSDSIETEEIKCCGSGCNNCVLDDRKTAQTTNPSKSTRGNILTVDGRKYMAFHLQQKWQCTENVWRFKYVYVNADDMLSNSMELAVPPGCHLMIRAAIDDMKSGTDRHDETTIGNFVSRPYTPIHIGSKGSFEILVKFEPNGLMSEYLRTSSVGDVVDVKGPYGDFKWTPNSARHLICVSQGVGIAPLFAVVSSILSNEEDETWIDFLACFRSIEDILLRDELHAFREYWNFQSTIYLANESACKCDTDARISNCVCIKAKTKYKEILCTFRLDETELAKLFIRKRIENCFVLVCGTGRFINSIKMSLEKLHIKAENLIVFD